MLEIICAIIIYHTILGAEKRIRFNQLILTKMILRRMRTYEKHKEAT